MPPAPDVEERLLHIACTRGLIGDDVKQLHAQANVNRPHA
jgi:hypothetical protein